MRRSAVVVYVDGLCPADAEEWVEGVLRAALVLPGAPERAQVVSSSDPDAGRTMSAVEEDLRKAGADFSAATERLKGALRGRR